jgi:two-component system, NarL family, response regulator NreC
MPASIVLADDHQIVRQGLQAILRTEAAFRVVGEAASGLDTVRLVSRLQPDVLLLDLMLPGLNGFEVIRRVAHNSPRTRIVVLTMHANEAYVQEALRAGARGYVLKESGAEELVQAIREVLSGGRFLSPPISEQTLRAYSEKARAAAFDPYETLTAREREVLDLTVEGNTSSEISKKLFISSRTVESHRTNLMRKLGLRNQKELIRYAVGRAKAAPESNSPSLG